MNQWFLNLKPGRKHISIQVSEMHQFGFIPSPGAQNTHNESGGYPQSHQGGVENITFPLIQVNLCSPYFCNQRGFEAPRSVFRCTRIVFGKYHSGSGGTCCLFWDPCSVLGGHKQRVLMVHAACFGGSCSVIRGNCNVFSTEDTRSGSRGYPQSVSTTCGRFRLPRR